MRFAWVGYGLLGVVGTTTLAIWFTVRAFEAAPPVYRNRLSEQLDPVTEGDDAWLGAYRLLTKLVELEFTPDGRFREKPLVSDGNCVTLGPPEGGGGVWHRAGAIVVLKPDEPLPALELELGRLDGEYVLLSEFSTWRRVPDVAATSSSR